MDVGRIRRAEGAPTTPDYLVNTSTEGARVFHRSVISSNLFGGWQQRERAQQTTSYGDRQNPRRGIRDTETMAAMNYDEGSESR